MKYMNYFIYTSRHGYTLLYVAIDGNIWLNMAKTWLYGYINNSRHLAQKYARIFVRGHYLFREANSFPRAKLEENCELRGTDNVQGQISEHIFAPNGDYCLYYPSNLFRNACSFENWGIFNNYSPKWR